MKKVLSFVLVLSMILGSFGMAFAAAPSDVVGKDYEDAVNVLMELGVVEGYKDGTYRPEKVVTRAEMATLIIKALGLNDYAVGKSSFSDMAGHWADAYVAYAASLGFISGYGDGTFRPNQTVTYDQAITMVVQALGYKAEYMVGGYPGAFVAQAKTLGMLDGIKSGAAGANRGDVATLLFNTLPVAFVRYDKNGSLEEIALQGDKKDTMLQRLGVEVSTDYFVVDERDADAALVNVTPYIGASVKAYLNDDGDIIAISEVQSTFMKGKLDDDTLTVDDVDYTLNKDALADVNKLNTTDTVNGVTSYVGALGFLNGEFDSTMVKADIKSDTEYTFAVKVSGKTIKAVYSVADWQVSKHDYFASADAIDIEEDAELFGFGFYKDNDQEIDTNRFELIGADNLSKIKKDDVVYVYAGKSDKITRVAVGTEVVEGKVSKVNSGETKFTVNGKVYEIASKNAGGLSIPSTGDEVKLTLNPYGDIYDFDKISGTDDYAVLLETANGTTGLNGKDAKVKLFLADGTTKTFVIDSDIKGYTSEKADGTIEIAAALKAGTIVQYHIDKDGEIDDIVIPAQETKLATAVTAKGTFSGKVIQTSAVIFTYDGDDETEKNLKDEDNYAIGKYNVILDSDKVDGTYVLDDKEIECILLKGFSATEDVYAIVNGWASIDGDYDYEVTVMENGASKTYDATSAGKTWAASASDVLYKLTFDAAGAIKGGDAVKSDSDNQVEDVTITTETAIDGRYLVVGSKNYTLADDVIVYKWDADDEEWTVGRTRDLDGLESAKILKLYSINGDDKDIFDIVMLKEK